MDQETLLLGGFGFLLAGALLTFLLRGGGAWGAASRAVALLAVAGSSACLGTFAARVLLGRACSAPWSSGSSAS